MSKPNDDDSLVARDSARNLSFPERVFRKFFDFKDMGWEEIGEEFTRFFLWRTKHGSLILHRLYSPNWHPRCHDHPWDFRTLILWGGYEEWAEDKLAWRGPLTFLYRPATFSHNVRTRGVAWSLLWIGTKSREWQMLDCMPAETLGEQVP